MDDSSYANLKESSRINGRQKTSISINSSNNHQIKPMLSKARSRENIASSHGNLSLSTNNLKGNNCSLMLSANDSIYVTILGLDCIDINT